MISKTLVQTAKLVTGLDSVVPSTSTPDYVSLKDYAHFTAVILVKNATTVTGSAITLKQATAVAGTSEKALSFTKMWANLDTAASDALVETAVTSDTFTTLTTNSKNQMYVIEVDAAQLDVSNGFDCIRVGTADATAATVTVLYVLSSPRYSQVTPPTAITD
jgi:hypothetical protein